MDLVIEEVPPSLSEATIISFINSMTQISLGNETPTNAREISPQVVKIYMSLPWCINQTYLSNSVFKLSHIPLSPSHLFTTFVGKSFSHNLAIHKQLNSNLPYITASTKTKWQFMANDTEFWRGQRPHRIILCYKSSILVKCTSSFAPFRYWGKSILKVEIFAVS